MRLADLLAVNLVSPLLLTMLLVVFFGERIGWRRWTAILVGFAGTLLIVRPSTSSLNVWALFGLGAAAAGEDPDLHPAAGELPGKGQTDDPATDDAAVVHGAC